ncbi:MAG: SPFH domain-containing protein [Acidobacteriales bacterium]|nr:SPFH domain-containing protein [Terriglobales bacterium]
MNEFLLALRQFLRSFRCWLIVSPWENALRVRLGKRVTLLQPGFHWKLPVLDVIYLQSIRLRLSPISKQTLSTRSGQVITIAGSLGYRIDDIERLYTTIHHAEDTIAALTRSRIAEYVSSHQLEDCRPETIQAAINETLDFSQYGLGGACLYITEFAVARAYRIIGDGNEYGWGKKLATDVVCTSAGDRT